MSLTDTLVEEIRERATTVGWPEAVRQVREALAAAEVRAGRPSCDVGWAGNVRL